MGRPSTYNPEIAQSIIEQLSEGIPLREICRQEGMPYWRTMYRWMEQDAELSTHIARARELGYDAIAEEALQIADTPVTAEELEYDGEGQVTKRTVRDALRHRALQIETRLKLLAKWNPKKYGDRIQQDVTVNDYASMSSEDRRRLIAELQQQLDNAERTG